MDRRPVIAFALALSGAGCSACGGGSSTPGGTTTQATTMATATVTRTGTATTRPRPPVLALVAAAHPGINVSWSEPTPCDTVEGERQDMITPYPSQATPPGPPLFSVPGATTSYLDTAPTQNFFYTYHVRCRVSGLASDWSNEFAANPIK